MLPDDHRLQPPSDPNSYGLGMITEVSLEILGMDSFLPIGCEHIEIPYWEGYKLLCVCVLYLY